MFSVSCRTCSEGVYQEVSIHGPNSRSATAESFKQAVTFFLLCHSSVDVRASEGVIKVAFFELIHQFTQPFHLSQVVGLLAFHCG